MTNFFESIIRNAIDARFALAECDILSDLHSSAFLDELRECANDCFDPDESRSIFESADILITAHLDSSHEGFKSSLRDARENALSVSIDLLPRIESLDELLREIAASNPRKELIIAFAHEMMINPA